MSVAAIVPAAGRGERLGPGAPKALRTLGGVPMLVYAVRSLAQARLVDAVVVAAPQGECVAVRSLLSGLELDAELTVTDGGETRQESVRRALAGLDADVDTVLVHDAARPLAPPELADAVARAVLAGADGAVPGVPVADTVKSVDAGGRVMQTVDRSAFRAVQTPQGFRRDTLTRAHADAAATGTFDVTDDAGLVERIGGVVVLVAGVEEAFKVTRPMDLALAEVVLARQRGTDGR